MIRKIVSPVITLLSTVLIMFMLFSVIYIVTAPTIEENNEKTANMVRMEVLPDADAFSKLEDIEYVDQVTEVYVATNGEGYAITSVIPTDAGNITVVTGLTVLGEIKGIKITDAGDGKPIDEVLNYSDVYIESLKASYGSTSRIESLLSEISADAYSAGDVLSGITAASMQVEALGGTF